MEEQRAVGWMTVAGGAGEEELHFYYSCAMLVKMGKNYNTLAKQLEKNMKCSLFSSQHTSVACKWYCRKVTLLLIFQACHAGDERGPGLSRNYTPISPQVQNSSSARKPALANGLSFLLPPGRELAPSRLGRSPAPTVGRFPARGISLEAVF